MPVTWTLGLPVSSGFCAPWHYSTALFSYFYWMSAWCQPISGLLLIPAGSPWWKCRAVMGQEPVTLTSRLTSFKEVSHVSFWVLGIPENNCPEENAWKKIPSQPIEWIPSQAPQTVTPISLTSTEPQSAKTDTHQSHRHSTLISIHYRWLQIGASVLAAEAEQGHTFKPLLGLVPTKISQLSHSVSWTGLKLIHLHILVYGLSFT